MVGLSPRKYYHSGNVVFRSAVANYAPFVRPYRRLPRTFSRQLADSILEAMIGRFLEQDWRNGQWKVMTGEETEDHIRKSEVQQMLKRSAQKYCVSTLVLSI